MLCIFIDVTFKYLGTLRPRAKNILNNQYWLKCDIFEDFVKIHITVGTQRKTSIQIVFYLRSTSI